LRELGGEPGLALVIIHHLDPTHASGLVDILSRSTPLPVTAATDGLRVENNHVYVIPPAQTLEVRGGKLCLTPRGEGPHHPIDHFISGLVLHISSPERGVSSKRRVGI